MVIHRFPNRSEDMWCVVMCDFDTCLSVLKMAPECVMWELDFPTKRHVRIWFPNQMCDIRPWFPNQGRFPNHVQCKNLWLPSQLRALKPFLVFQTKPFKSNVAWRFPKHMVKHMVSRHNGCFGFRWFHVSKVQQWPILIPFTRSGGCGPTRPKRPLGRRSRCGIWRQRCVFAKTLCNESFEHVWNMNGRK